MSESISNVSEFSHKPVSQRYLIWRRFTRHKLGVLGGIVLLFLLLIFIFAEFISPYSYVQTHSRLSYVPPMIDRVHWEGFAPYVWELRQAPAFVEINGVNQRLPGVYDYQENTEKKLYIRFFTKGDPYKLWGMFPMDIHLFGTGEAPTSRGQFFIFGTNNQGVDLLSQALMAGRTTLALAPLVIFVSFLLGIVVGGFSGYLAGGWDTFLQRIAEIFMSLPRLALLLTVFGMLPGLLGFISPEARFWSIVLLLSAITWAPLARVIRGQFLALRESEFTQAARALGAGDLRIVFRQILPNIMSYVIVAATLSIPDIIILESILSFLGYGIKFPMTSWGELLNIFQGSGFNFQMQFHPWLLIPAVFIVITVLALNFLGDALRDAFDPFNVVSGDEVG
jgi:peptide/nickel transport system permease protein